METTRDINEYVENLLCDKAFLKKEYASFLDNTYSVEDVDGVISAEILARAIQKARKSGKMRAMLGEILIYESYDVTKYGVEKCIKYAEEKYGASEKTEAAKRFCEKMK